MARDGSLEAATSPERVDTVELKTTSEPLGKKPEPVAVGSIVPNGNDGNPVQNANESMEAPSISCPLKTPKHKSKYLPPIPAATPRDDDAGRIRLGICAMDKKARSRPMAEILSRLDEDSFCVVFFGDAVLKNEAAKDWPVCDVLIAFYSKGYPLQKAKEYVELRKPFILNDLDMQELLQDRRRVYDLLEASGIDVPRHVYLSRDGYVSTGSGDGDGAKDQEVKEFDDHIVVNGVLVNKPFVEKPVNAEGEYNGIAYLDS